MEKEKSDKEDNKSEEEENKSSEEEENYSYEYYSEYYSYEEEEEEEESKNSEIKEEKSTSDAKNENIIFENKGITDQNENKDNNKQKVTNLTEIDENKEIKDVKNTNLEKLENNQNIDNVNTLDDDKPFKTIYKDCSVSFVPHEPLFDEKSNNAYITEVKYSLAMHEPEVILSPTPRRRRIKQNLVAKQRGKCPSRIQKLKERAEKKKKLNNIDEETFEDILYYLEEDKQQCVKKNEFEKSSMIQETIEYVNKCQMEEKIKSIKEEQCKEADSEIKQCKEEMKRFDNETVQLKKDLKEKQSKKRKILEIFYSNRIAQIEEEWTKPAKQRMYNRPTNKLLSMKRQLSYLLIQNRFDEAADLEKYIKAVQREEEKASYEIMQRAFDESIRQRQIKNDSEMETFESKCKLELAQFNKQRNIQKRTLEYKLNKAIAKKEKISNEDKLLTCAIKRNGLFDNSISCRPLTQEKREEKTTYILSLPPLVVRPQTSDPRRRKNSPT